MKHIAYIPPGAGGPPPLTSKRPKEPPSGGLGRQVTGPSLRG